MVTARITDSLGVAARAAAAGDVGALNFAFDTPFAHPNGTLYVVTAGRAILRADDWRGQAHSDDNIAPLFFFKMAQNLDSIRPRPWPIMNLLYCGCS